MSQDAYVPTDEEKKNGWDEKTLTEYINERLMVESIPDAQPKVINNYDPMRW